MGRIPWDSPAILVPPGNRDNIKGTLASCLRHWRDEMNPTLQVTSMIAMGGGRWLEPEEMMGLIPTLPAEPGPHEPNFIPPTPGPWFGP